MSLSCMHRWLCHQKLSGPDNVNFNVLQRLQQMLPSCLSNAKSSRWFNGLRLERLKACKRLKFVAALAFDHEHRIDGKQLPLYNTLTSSLCCCASVPSRPLHCGTSNTEPTLVHNSGVLIAYTIAAHSHYCKGTYYRTGTVSRSTGHPPQS